MRTAVLISQFVSLQFNDTELVRRVCLQINSSLSLQHTCTLDKEQKEREKKGDSYGKHQRLSNDCDLESVLEAMRRSFLLSMSRRMTNGRKRDNMPLLDVPLDDTHPAVDPTVTIEQPCAPPPVDDHAKYLRAKLRFFFMSPCWKWHLFRQFPWKAWFQFLKIVILTTQVLVLAANTQALTFYFFLFARLADSLRHRTRSARDFHCRK